MVTSFWVPAGASPWLETLGSNYIMAFHFPLLSLIKEIDIHNERLAYITSNNTRQGS